MSLGKGLGGGVPIGTLVAKQSACCFEYGDQGGTYNGNPLVCAVASTVFEQISRADFLADVCRKGEYLRQGLQDISEFEHVRDVRGMGLLIAIEFDKPIAKLVAQSALSDYAFIINACSPTTIRLMPALNAEWNSIELALTYLRELVSAHAA